MTSRACLAYRDLTRVKTRPSNTSSEISVKDPDFFP